VTQPSQAALYSSVTVLSPTAAAATKAQSDAEECARFAAAAADCGLAAPRRSARGTPRLLMTLPSLSLDAEHKAATAAKEQV